MIRQKTIYLSPDFRVRPLDHLQWVLERRKQARESGVGPRAGEWKAFAYCRTRAGLETALSRLRADDNVHLDASLISHLPTFFPEQGNPLGVGDGDCSALI